MLKNSMPCFDFSFAASGSTRRTARFERLRLRDLRADVHLHAAQPEILQFGRARIHALDFLKRDAELVFVGAGRDLRVRVRADVRVHAHGDWRDFFQLCRDPVDALQFRLALDVEGINIFAQREFDLRRRLGDAGEDTFSGSAPAARARCSSPPLTTSKPPPRSASVRNTARFELDLTAKQTRWPSGASARSRL